MQGSKSILILNVAIILVLLLILVLRPIALDQAHQADTLLLAQLGWRGVNGILPIADYPHFWGGLTARIVTLSFTLFGVSFKALDYAFALVFILSVLALWTLAWRRLRPAGSTLLTTLAAALIISFQPIEFGFPRVTHSYVYNHFAIVLMMALVIFALMPAATIRAERISSIAAGAVLYALALLKPTFAVMVPCVLLACLVQRRIVSAGLVVAGIVLTMLLFDPGMTRVLSSLDYLMGSGAAERSGGVSGLLRTAFLMIMDHLLGLLLAFALVMGVVAARGRAATAYIVSAMLLAAGYGAAILTTAGIDTFKLLPFLTVFALVTVQSRSVPSSPSPAGLLERALPICMAYALILPALMAAANGGLHAVRYAGSALVAEGPLASYYLHGEASRTIPGLGLADADARRAAAVERTLKMYRNTRRIDDSGEFVLLADGVALLEQVPGVRELGIVANGRMFDFTVPLKSRVVPEFPVWATPMGSGIRSLPDMPDTVDLVMMSVKLPNPPMLDEALHNLMGEAFAPCLSSTFWTLYARVETIGELCEGPEGRSR